MLGKSLGLGEHMILGRGEEKTGGRRKQALLADTTEALIAAVYLDGGLEPARQFLLRELSDTIETAGQPDYFGRDHKSRLQEALQALGRPLPIYRVAGEIGPDHRKLFHVEVQVGGETIAQGAGRTKKDAEQDAGDIEGGVVAYQVGFTLFLLPHALFAVPALTALFPRLSRQASIARSINGSTGSLSERGSWASQWLR